MSTPQPPRLRLVGWEVRPVIMLDDGELLTPLAIDGQFITAADWSAFKDGGDEQALDQLRGQVASHDQ